MEKSRRAEAAKRAVEIFDHDTEFPGFVFISAKWKTRLFDGIPFHNAQSLETFLAFIQAQENTSFTICGQHPTKTIMEQGEGSYTCLQFAVAGLSQAGFKAYLEEEFSFNAVSWYLFAEKGDWGIYIDTHFDVFVAGYDAGIENEITAALAGEKSFTAVGAIEQKLAENIANKELLKKQAEEIGKNYLKIPKKK